MKKCNGRNNESMNVRNQQVDFMKNYSFMYDWRNSWASQVALVVKNLPVTAGALRDVRSILESGRSPGGGHGNPLQYSCLENPMDRGAWWATVHRVAKSRTWLRWLSMHAKEFVDIICFKKLCTCQRKS